MAKVVKAKARHDKKTKAKAKIKVKVKLAIKPTAKTPKQQYRGLSNNLTQQEWSQLATYDPLSLWIETFDAWKQCQAVEVSMSGNRVGNGPVMVTVTPKTIKTQLVAHHVAVGDLVVHTRISFAWDRRVAMDEAVGIVVKVKSKSTVVIRWIARSNTFNGRLYAKYDTNMLTRVSLRHIHLNLKLLLKQEVDRVSSLLHRYGPKTH